MGNRQRQEPPPNIIKLNNKSMSDIQALRLIQTIPLTVIDIQLMEDQIGCNGLRGIANKSFNSLIVLELGSNKIGNKGCKYISSLNAPKLSEVGLYNNHIQAQGVLHLSKANWKQLKKLWLGQNKISTKGLTYLIRFKLPKLQLKEQIVKNKITFDEMLLLVLFDSKFMKVLSLRENRIDQGNGLNRQRDRLVRLIRQKHPIYNESRLFDL